MKISGHLGPLVLRLLKALAIPLILFAIFEVILREDVETSRVLDF